MRSLIDEFLPHFDARERHSTIVRAPAARIYAALRTVDLAASPVVRLLLAIRALPSVVLGRRAWRDLAQAPVTLATFERAGCAVLAERPPDELLLGLVGRFWTLRGDLRPVTAETFRLAPPAGTARAAWNFTTHEQPDGTTELRTETRVECADAESRRRFRIYWMVVRPGSGLIRLSMLRAIRDAAESGTA